MNYTNKITKNFLYFFRQLQDENPSKGNQTIPTPNNDVQKQQLRDLYIYIAILIIIIIIILGGYALYRKCVEKKALQEIEREYQVMLMNLLNSISSQISSSQEDKRPQSYNNINPNNIQNIDNDLGSHNISMDLNHEDRMEKIRKKFGNSVIIKCLLKKQIEEIKYNKKYGEEFGDMCTICMDKFVELTLISKTPCEHIFHKKCFDTYLKEIQKKDKLLCPNCNQNLLINKKFLKLRAKSKKIEIKKNIISKKEEKESEVNLENEIKNRNSVMTNKNEDYIPSNNNEIIFLKKKYKKDKNKISDTKNKNINIFKDLNNNNIYNPLHIKIKRNNSDKNDIDTIIPNDKKEEEDEENNDKIKKRNVIIINRMDKKNVFLKNALSSVDSKSKMYNKKKKLNISVNSERERFVFTKKTGTPNISTKKK